MTFDELFESFPSPNEAIRQLKAERFVRDRLEEIKGKYIKATLRYRMALRPLFKEYHKTVDFFDLLFISLLDKVPLAHDFFKSHRDEVIGLIKGFISDLNNLKDEIKHIQGIDQEQLLKNSRLEFEKFNAERHLVYFERNEW